MKRLSIATLGFALLAAPVFAQSMASGDAASGEKVFAKCKACHSIVDDAGETIMRGGKTGPNLYGVAGRTAGTTDFKYGDAIIEAGENGLVWGEEIFLDYVADPRKFLISYLDDRRAKSKMTFKLTKDDDALDVWAYLVSVGPEGAATN